MAAEWNSWTWRRHVRRSLFSSDEVLNITFRHDRRFSSPRSCIQSNVPVKVQTEALALVEFNHQNPPPE